VSINIFLNNFILQAQTSNLKTSNYPKDWGVFKMKVSFGIGMPAKAPWMALTLEGMQVGNGYYPCYLY